MNRSRVLILGAAGKDFHVFNTCYRGRSEFEVVAFTATQIPDIDDRRYPAELAGSLYPDGIPIEDEARLGELIRELGADMCVMSYSDRSYQQVMSLGSLVNAAGADFVTSARGFMFAPILAYNLNAGFVPVRKPGKLPGPTDEVAYELEYGSNRLQIHKGELVADGATLVIDDLLATGGTEAASPSPEISR